MNYEVPKLLPSAFILLTSCGSAHLSEELIGKDAIEERRERRDWTARRAGRSPTGRGGEGVKCLTT